MLQEKRYLKAREVADLLRVTPAQVYQMAKENAIPHIKFGGTVRFPEADVLAWTEQNTIKAEAV